MPIDTVSLMKQVAGIRIVTSRLVDQRFCGEYHSVFKGQGIEFNEVRPYVAGDDVRSIDWNVTARVGTPHIKRFTEERELTVLFLVDVSGSQLFGSGHRTKAQRTAELTCLLALSAIRNQDKVGLVLFSDRVRGYLPPRKGRTAVMRLVREVVAAEARRQGTDLDRALRFVRQVQKRRAVLFVVSDFQAAHYERSLRACARRHDVVACVVRDPAEAVLPNAGLVDLVDPETGACIRIDSGSGRIRRAFARRAQAHQERLRDLFSRNRIDAVFLDTEQPYVDTLRRLFQRRIRRR